MMQGLQDLDQDIVRMIESGGNVTIAHNGAVSGCYRNQWNGRTDMSGIYGTRADYLVSQAIARGVLVVDYRPCTWNDVYDVAVKGPMLADCGEQPDPAPYNSLSKAPRDYWLQLRHKIGATIHNG